MEVVAANYLRCKITCVARSPATLRSTTNPLSYRSIPANRFSPCPNSNGVNQPFGVAAGPWGYVYVANFGGGTVTSYDAKGNLVNTITGLVNPLNLTVDGLSDVWVIDQSLTRLSVFDLGNASIYSQSLAGSTTSAFLGVSEYGGLLSLLSSNSTDNVVSALTADLLHSGTSVGISGTVPGSPSSIVLDSKAVSYTHLTLPTILRV